MLRNTVLLFPGPGAHRGKYATVLELSRRGVHRGRGTRGKRGRTGLPTSVFGALTARPHHSAQLRYPHFF